MGERWGRVPAGVPSAQAGVYRALSMIAGRRGETTCRVKVIAEGAGRSIRRTQAALRKLEEEGWLRIRERPGRSSTYRLFASQAPTQALLGFAEAPVSPMPRGDAASGVIPPGRVTESSWGGDGIVRGGVTESSGVTPRERAVSPAPAEASDYTAGGERSSAKETSERGSTKRPPDGKEQPTTAAGEEPFPLVITGILLAAKVGFEAFIREWSPPGGETGSRDRRTRALAALIRTRDARKKLGAAEIGDPERYWGSMLRGESAADYALEKAKEMVTNWERTLLSEDAKEIIAGIGRTG